MKVSLNWLKDYVPIRIPAEKLAHRLTMAGLEVEKIESFAGDVLLELEITPNRPDCLNMLGLAREISAILNTSIKWPRKRKIRYPNQPAPIEILDKEGCKRYIGVVIRGVNVQASSEFIQKRIQTIGMRPINNVVDITNFCLLETGQPFHAFDYDKLVGGKIIVRRARLGEKIMTLDGIERTLDPTILVIADSKRAVAIAGIMGGKETEVGENTKNILLESAYFDPVLIRRACRSLGLSSESSYRFERGVDIQMIESHTQRAIALLKQEAGGNIGQYKDLFPSKRQMVKHEIQLSQNQIESFLGANLTASRCKTLLKKQDFKVNLEQRKIFKIIPPTFRADVKQAVDVMEEIARIIGYDALPMTFPHIKISKISGDRKRSVKGVLRDVLNALGFSEVITYSMINQNILEKTYLAASDGIRIKNPLTQDQDLLRPSLLPSLLTVIRSNFHRGNKDLKIFEIGKRYSACGEEDTLALVMTGLRSQDWRLLKKEKADFYDIKGVVEQIAKRMGGNPFVFNYQETDFFERGQGIRLSLEGKNQSHDIGILGQLRKEVLNNWDIKEDHVYYVQLNLELFYQFKQDVCQYQPSSEYPAIMRDISLAVKKEISFQKVQEIAFQEGGDFLVAINFIEQYLGEKIPPGRRGLVFSLVYQSSSRTLIEEEVNKVHKDISQALVEKLGAVIR